MKILIDLQACQSASRHRGIGRYSHDLTKAILQLAKGKHEVFLLLTDLLPEERDAVASDFASMVPSDHVLSFEGLGPVKELQSENAGRRVASELLREHAIRSIQPDIIHLSSLFEGLGDDVVTSIESPDLARKTAVTWYDMIPFVQPDVYLQISGSKAHYFRKIEAAKHAERLFAISQYSADEAIELLGVHPSKVVNIRGGVDSKFCVAPRSPERLRPLGIEQRYVLYTSSFDPRKNQAALVEAFATMPVQTRDRYQLVLVGEVWEAKRDELQSIASENGLDCSRLVMTGQVDETTLLSLYQNAHLFVFPSMHEGLGLPALESMSCGVPAIGSNCTGLPEVIGRQDALFDPTDIQSICAKMSEVLSNDGFHADLATHGLAHVEQFQWQHSASKVFEHYLLIHEEKLRIGAAQERQIAAASDCHQRLVDSIASVALEYQFSSSELTWIARAIEKNEALSLSS